MTFDHYHLYEYEGTIESFELLLKHKGYDLYGKGWWPFEIKFLTKNFKETILFTGIIQLANGLILRKGDCYIVECNCKLKE